MSRCLKITFLIIVIGLILACRKDDVPSTATGEENTTEQDDGVLPKYYSDYLNSKENEIRIIQLGIPGVEDSFIFITDTHWMENNGQSPRIIVDILKRGLTNKVIFGGDLMHAYSVDGNNPLEKASKQIDFHRAFAAEVTRYGHFFNVRGNHDINATLKTNSNDTGTSWSLPYQTTKNLLFQQMWEGGYIRNERIGGYEYVYDNIVKQIRYIILSCTSLKDTTGWLIEQFYTTPSGYSIVIINHYGATNATVSETGTPPIAYLNELLSAVNARTSGSVLNREYDFTNADYDIMAYFSGHTHKNLQSFSGGVVHICTACDAKYSENPFLGEKEYDRTEGTINEQLFDFVQIDKTNNILYCKRIGAGGDRFFHRTPVEVNVNNSVILSSSLLTGFLVWGAYDNDSKAVKTNPLLTKVRVNNGSVTGLSVGEAVVFAMDAKGNREFFDVIIR